MRVNPSRVDDSETSLRTMASKIVCGNRAFIAELRVEIRAGGVVLHGLAYSYYGKQLAQELVLHWGMLPIVANQIVVTTGDPALTKV